MERELRFSQFVDWTREHIQGDEKGEAQIFLDRLFRAFGHEGVKEAGAVLEARVRRGPGASPTFADLVWRPIVLIEMKARGADLRGSYRQAFDYWTRLVPGRPRYVVLCNFDEFWVYDFENQMDVPVDQVRLEELPTNFGSLAFLFPTGELPVFRNAHEEVTRGAADRLALCFNKLTTRGVSRDVAQRFVLQLLVAFFAEDIGLLERYSVARLLDDCSTPKDSFDLLGDLFQHMNTPGVTVGGRYKGVPYFNGGIFAEPARIELAADELNQVRSAAGYDWSKVRPEIFGTLFEHSLGKEERHAFGAHFTSPIDIMKIVGPTIVEPWQSRIENASTVKELRKLLSRLHNYRVLDPACGSGNFLYIAYREVKRLEARLLERIGSLSKRADPEQRELGFVTASNFRGIDINSFAIELAKVTMMLGRKLAIDELHITENALPLDNLNESFLVADALLDESSGPRQWPAADVIIGNPPFLGAKRLKPERGEDYVRQLRNAYPAVPAMADYCVYWFRKANDHLRDCTVDDPLAGRAGLVGTQNIRNNKSREGGLDHIVASGTIVEAVDNEPWPGEAVVHVSIVNWVKSKQASLVPAAKRLWVYSAAGPTGRGNRRRSSESARAGELTIHLAPEISSSLSDEEDVSGAVTLLCNTQPQVAFQGVIPGYEGFVISLAEREQMIRLDDNCREVARPYLIGRDLLTGDGSPSRAVIDFGARDLLSARAFAPAFELMRREVLPEVEATAIKAQASDMEAARNQHLQRWWQFWNVRIGMRASLEKLPRYLACSRVTKRPIFCFVDPSIVPDCALQVFALADDYSFAVLQSSLHWEWFIAKCSKLKADFRYTPGSVFDTFPWPQEPRRDDIEKIARLSRELRQLRHEAVASIDGGLRAIYKTLELPGTSALRECQEALDATVTKAYGFRSQGRVMSALLALNGEVADRLARGERVQGPGVPAQASDAASLVSSDAVLSPPI